MFNGSSYVDLTRDELISLLEHPEPGVRITFAGKSTVREIALRLRPRVMQRVAKYCVGTEEQQAASLVIEGENLQAMVSLYRFRGQVDFILTDPPYNTGNDFRYNDRWENDPNDPDLGDIVSSDDGARHTKWMKFMWPRLKFMKSMLKPTGVLAVCIDHRELFRLGTMLDEIFDEKNRLAIINWQKTYSPKNNVGEKTHVSTATEYVLVYANDIELAKTRLLDRTERMNARYVNWDDDPKGPWKKGVDFTGRGASTHWGQVYAIQNPFTGLMVSPSEGRCWAAERARVKAYVEAWGVKYMSKDMGDGRAPALVIHGSQTEAKRHAEAVLSRYPWPEVYWTDGGAGTLAIKKYINRVRKGFVPMTYWADEEYDSPEILGSVSWDHEQSGHSQTGLNELNDIVGKGHGFDTIKPLKLCEKLIQIWCPPNGLVLDPFAGSGTTGHAVLRLNKDTGASRRFVMIEQGRPDKGDPYARSLTVDRLSHAISGKWAKGKHPALGGGFTFFTLRSKVDAPAVLAMERDLMADTVIASHYDVMRRGGPSLIRMFDPRCHYLVARNQEREGFFLVWDGPDKSPILDAGVYEAIVSEALTMKLAPIYHVYARFNLYQSDDIRFYQIPNRILMDFGLSEALDAFNENIEDGQTSESDTVGVV